MFAKGLRIALLVFLAIGALMLFTPLKIFGFAIMVLFMLPWAETDRWVEILSYDELDPDEEPDEILNGSEQVITENKQNIE